jgi:PAS domain S-box-containing protein
MTFVSRYAEELLGYPTERWLGDPSTWGEAVHPDDRPWVERARHLALRDGRSQELEYRMRAADGRWLWFREALRPAIDDQGRTVKLRGVLWHISRRKKVEREFYAERREQAERLSDISYLYDISSRLSATTELEPLLEEILAAAMAAQGADMGVLRLLDRERGDLVAVASHGLEEFLRRYGRVEVGDPPCGLAISGDGPVIIEDVEADPRFTALKEAARLGGFRAAYTTPLRTRSGELVGTLTNCFREPHHPSERQARLVAVYARQAADSIENARLYRECREADRRKDEQLATVAHELRGPLGVILNAVHLMRQAPPGSVELDLVERQARQMARLAEDLIDQARIRRGTLELRVEPLDLLSIVADAVGAIRTPAAARGIELSVDVPSGPLPVAGDRMRLDQVLSNLLANALRYTEAGGSVHLVAGREGEEAIVRVRDTGVGIASELLPRVFEPFVQGEATAGSQHIGLGIGLSLVRHLVELHGGTVAAASEGPGRGSEFSVRLPLSTGGEGPCPT